MAERRHDYDLPDVPVTIEVNVGWRHADRWRKRPRRNGSTERSSSCLNELRLTLPGVQVLFAFLLILPLQQRFSILTDAEPSSYVLALLATTAATICLIAPASYHRLRFRAGDKQRMLFISNRLAIVGIFFLALAMVAGLFLITEVVVGAGVAVAIAAAAAVTVGVLWYGLPLFNKLRDGD